MDTKYQLGTAENKTFMQSIREELLTFGQYYPAPSGASYWLGDDGTPWKERPRETWITARMVHVYSIGMMLKHAGGVAPLREKKEALVDAGLRGLAGELHDDRNGGWYPGVEADGTPLPGKQCYAHAFVMLAASSAMLAGRPGADQLLQEASDTFLKRFWDDEKGLTFDTWNTEFTELDPYRGINANMHTVEAFLAVSDALGQESWRKRAGHIIDRVIGWAKENEWRIPEHYTSEWTPDLECNRERPDDQFKPYGATPGHGIEWARLITQYATSLYAEQSEELAFYLEASEQLYQRAITDAWNVDGARGIVYTTDWTGAPVVHDRMHWTLAEAINTSAVLHQVTGKDRYAKDYAMFLAYLDECVLDHVNGSWFHQLDQNNKLLTTVWPGKSDLYHAFQSTLIPYLASDVSIAKAVQMQQDNIK